MHRELPELLVPGFRGQRSRRQLTYNGRPLYTFRLDDAPGQAHGHNFTDSFGGQTFTWHAATAGTTVSAGTPAPTQSGSPSAYNSYQGGY